MFLDQQSLLSQTFLECIITHEGTHCSDRAITMTKSPYFAARASLRLLRSLMLTMSRALFSLIMSRTLLW